METIEQLKQDNAKLQERLNNAAKFFREQKAQIETLTKERDELKSQYDDIFDASVKLGEEIEELKAQLHKQENIVDQDATIKGLREELEEYREKNKKSKDELNSKEKQLNEYELKLQNSEAAYEQLRKKYEVRKGQQVELLGQIEGLKNQLEQRIQQIRAIENTTNEEVKKVTVARDEFIVKCRDLEAELNDLKAINKEINILKGETELKLSTIQKEYEDKFNEQEKELQLAKDSSKVLKDTISDLQKENKDAEEQFNKVLNSYENDLAQAQMDKNDMTITINDLTKQLSTSVTNQTKYQEFTEMIINLVDSFNNNGNNIDTDKHSSITVNTYKNSTGSQFMSDAPGMNI